MSSRQLRKLQKQKELEALQSSLPEKVEESESEDELPIQTKPKPSLFSSFAALGDEEEEQNEEDEASEPELSKEEPERTHTPKSATKKSKKKKKKARKSAIDAPDNISATPRDENKSSDAIDEIDQALEELNLKAQVAGGSQASFGATPATIAYERICELLRVNTHHLKVINEMRNLFGREAIAAANSEEQTEEQNRNRRRGLQQLQQTVDLETYLKGLPGRSLPEVTLRRNPFLPGKETWPRAATDGLTMKQIKDGTVDTKCGTVEFGFAHGELYDSLERQFFQLVQMYDPMRLVHFLHSHPYHISTLIQVSKVAKQDQNSALAGDLCERALFTFGRVSLSTFRQKMEEGKARIEFRRPENRQFWLAGYHYLKSLTMKGTYRTALEWTKLLFSMDLSDPYGLVHFMHPLAIRAHESKWFIDFCDSEALDECETAQDYVRQTLVLARLQQQDTAGAKALAIEGMEKLPWLYSAIFKSLNLDVPRAVWGLEPRNDHENLFTELYIHQTKQLWDNAQTVGLLKEAASLAQKPSLNSLPTPPIVGRNAGRFVYLDNTPALMGLVPGGMLHGFPNWDFDPLPPTKGENIFSYDSQELPWNPDRPVAREVDLNNLGGREGLQRMLQQALEGNAPPDIRRALEQALAQIDGDGDGDSDADTSANNDNADSGDEDRDNTRPRQNGDQGIWSILRDVIWPIQHMHEQDEGDNSDQDYEMAGGWPSDSDDELPAIIHEAIPDEAGNTSTPQAPTENQGQTEPNRRQEEERR